jgi:exodeoxyribonuclease VII large subunit
MQIHSVAEVTGYLRGLLEADDLLTDIWVSGEVSSLSESAAGHLYFTLKDEASQLRCVLFNRARLPVAIENGMAVVAHGRISIYEVTGALQLYVDTVQPEGMGLLYLEFERLKAKLQEEGLFAPERKRDIPAFPQRIGVVTSPDSAVLHDIINIITRRYPLVELTLCPTPVQGDGAVAGIVRAFDSLNAVEDIDVVILARGGGSMEDLQAFNQEPVARAVCGSRAPVISGVGHETDFTIADFVADLRAPTPSAAAELAVPSRDELDAQLISFSRGLSAVLSGTIDRCRQQADDTVSLAGTHLDNIVGRYKERLLVQELALDSLNPLATLGRGYALVQHAGNGEVVSSITQVERGDSLDIKVSDGQFGGRVSGSKKGLQACMKGFPSNKH